MLGTASSLKMPRLIGCGTTALCASTRQTLRCAYVNVEANAELECHSDHAEDDHEEIDWMIRAYQGRDFIDSEVAMDIIMDTGETSAADDVHMVEEFDKLLHNQKAIDASVTFSSKDDFDRILNVKSVVESDMALAISSSHLACFISTARDLSSALHRGWSMSSIRGNITL